MTDHKGGNGDAKGSSGGSGSTGSGGGKHESGSVKQGGKKEHRAARVCSLRPGG
jgi:hypothetical protein